MNRSRYIPLASLSLAGLVLASGATAQLRISQVGKGSGLSPNAYNGNFVEIYNAGSTPVSLNGKSIQWASSAGGASWTKFDLTGTIAPGGYWLVRLTATNSINPNDGFGVPFTADQDRLGFNGTFFSLITATNGGGKVVLADTTTLFNSNGCVAPNSASVIDLVSWDDVPSTAVCHEGTACALIPLPTAYMGSTSVLRKCGGIIDTNDNLADFVTTARPPRSSSFGGDPAAPAVDGMTQVAGRVERAAATGYAGESVLFTSTPTSCSGTISSVVINLATIGGSGAQIMLDNGTGGDVVAGDGTYSVQFTLPSNATLGFQQLTISATDSAGLTGHGVATITVAPVPPANDLCNAAEVIPAGPLPLFVSASGNLLSAGPITQIATSCTTNGGNAGTSRDVWYSFTPAVTSFYTISTCNSVTAPGLFTSLDTVLGIYSTCPDESSPDHQGLTLACNDNGCTSFIGGSPSTISLFAMDAGTTYLIRVARRGSNSSVVGAPFRLDILSEAFGACCLPNGTCTVGLAAACTSGVYQGDTTTCGTNCPAPPAPANNECATATTLQLGVPDLGTSYGASGTDITSCDETSWDVWYNFTPPLTGDYRVTATRTGGSETPAIAVFAACPPATDSHLACVAANYLSDPNTLDFSATAGTQYFIRTATHFSQRADYTVVVNQQPGVCCRGATCAVGVSAASCQAVGLAGAAFTPGSACNASAAAITPCCHADFNKSGSVSVQDIFDFLGSYFTGSPYTDINSSGASSVQDIFDFLGAYFAGC